MSAATRIGTASLLALVAAVCAIHPAAAAPAQKPDPELCADYLKDLKSYRRMAEQLGCQIPGATRSTPAKLAAAQTDEVSFPPVEGDEPAVQATQFPPTADTPKSSESTVSFPPVEQASADPEPAEMPPVAEEPSHGSSGGSRATSSTFPSTAEAEPDTGIEDPSDPVSEIRTAIEEKLADMKAEAKAHIEDAVLEKADEVKERVKDKIRHKLEDVISHHNDNGDNPGNGFRHKVEARLHGAAKDAFKKLVKEHHSHDHGGGLLHKLAQLRRH